MINEEDIDNFIKKCRFYKEKSNQIQIKLFPTKELPEEKIDIIIRDLRLILSQKKISYYELF